MIFGVEVTGDAANAITLSGVIVTLGGVIAWVLKSALPSLLRDFGERLDRIQTQHSKELTDARVEFRQEIAFFRADLKEINAANVAMNSKIGNSIDKLTDEIAAIKALHHSV